MYKFTVEYCFERYHTGSINAYDTRKAVVFADNSDEALKKIMQVDSNYICVASLTFEEVVGE